MIASFGVVDVYVVFCLCELDGERRRFVGRMRESMRMVVSSMGIAKLSCKSNVGCVVVHLGLMVS